MDSSSSTAPVIKKQEDDDKNEKRDIKPVPTKTLNRVPRACNACRKQKMRCEGADNPPCKRCRNTGLECLFEKPSREATLTGEAGLERIRSLENHVSQIRQTQDVISNTLQDLVNQLRQGGHSIRSPSAFPVAFQQSPSINSPSVSTPTPTVSHQHISPPTGSGSITSVVHASGSNTSVAHPQRMPYMNPPVTQGGLPSYEDHRTSLHSSNFPPNVVQSHGQHNQQPQSHILPPFSSFQTQQRLVGVPAPQPNIAPSTRPEDVANQRPSGKHLGTKRQAPYSNATSAESSDLDDDDGGDLPISGLLAPWEVLRGLADVAIERAAKENGDSNSEPHSRARTPSPERHSRPSKRRKIRHKLPPVLTYPDVVTKGNVSEREARELFKIFYDGCSTFLPVFDAATDTFDALHERSPFAVNAICMVAARVRDGGQNPSDTYKRCLEEVHAISSATLFVPVTRTEVIQSMILVSGWSDNGWLSLGHAVRMAMELSLHQSWPKLRKRISSGKVDVNDDHDLVIASRTWFCLYLFEHQLSYGTGRPAILKNDSSIRDCRELLNHPLHIEDDARLVSTVELIALREEAQDQLEFDRPLDPKDFIKVGETHAKFAQWYHIWDQHFSTKYENAAFYRQSLQIQQVHAELFHNATVLRNIIGPEDVRKMPSAQRDIALRSIQIARQGLDITVNSPSYRKGMTYAVHYTHVTATFTASLLLRLARLFPDDCNIADIRDQIERLSNLLAELPGKRYAMTLQLMLKRSKRRKDSGSSRSPTANRDPHRLQPMSVEQHTHPAQLSASQHVNSQQYSPAYDMGYPMAGNHPHNSQISANAMAYHPYAHQTGYQEEDAILRGLESTSTDQLPVWISDQNLGGQSFSQHGMDAFIIPTEYLPPPTQIW